MDDERVLGVDACKAGWVGVALGEHGTNAYAAATIAELVSLAEAGGALSVVAVDMPIGLPDRGRRRADELARAAVGPLRSSVFITPVRAALDAGDHATAVAINRARAGEGVSRQAFGLKAKLQEVDRWVPHARHRVVEIHPEVCFADMAGAPLTVRKSTWAGAEQRRELLAASGVAFVGDLGAAGRSAGVDDVLDAGAAAWAARRVARGEARPRPDPPERFSDGLACAVWS